MSRSCCRVAAILAAVVTSCTFSGAVVHAAGTADADRGYRIGVNAAEPQLASSWGRCTAADVCFTFMDGAQVGLSGTGFAMPNVRLDDVAHVEAGVYYAGCQQMDMAGHPMQPLVLVPHVKVAIPAGVTLHTCWQQPA